MSTPPRVSGSRPGLQSAQTHESTPTGTTQPRPASRTRSPSDPTLASLVDAGSSLHRPRDTRRRSLNSLSTERLQQQAPAGGTEPPTLELPQQAREAIDRMARDPEFQAGLVQQVQPLPEAEVQRLQPPDEPPANDLPEQVPLPPSRGSGYGSIQPSPAASISSLGESTGEAALRVTRSIGVLLARTVATVGPSAIVRQFAIPMIGRAIDHLPVENAAQLKLKAGIVIAALPLVANVAGGIADELRGEATPRTRIARAINMMVGMAGLVGGAETGELAEQATQMMGNLMFSALRDSLEGCLGLEDSTSGTNLAAELMSAGAYTGYAALGNHLTSSDATRPGREVASAIGSGNPWGDGARAVGVTIMVEFLDELTFRMLHAMLEGKPFDVKFAVPEFKPSWKGSEELVRNLMNRTSNLNMATVYPGFADKMLSRLGQTARDHVTKPLNEALQSAISAGMQGATYVPFLDQEAGARLTQQARERREGTEDETRPLLPPV
jgi:hypothetical protein